MVNHEEVRKIIEIKYPNAISDVEMLNVIRKFIYDVKGRDVGEIERPGNKPCPYFIQKAITRGVNPFAAMEKGAEVFLMEFMFICAHMYYLNKFNENLQN